MCTESLQRKWRSAIGILVFELLVLLDTASVFASGSGSTFCWCLLLVVVVVLFASASKLAGELASVFTK